MSLHRCPTRVAGCLATAAVALAATAAGATSTRDVLFVGAEVPPISSTLGTFAGVSVGSGRLAWRAQIRHEHLSGAKVVAVTGGTFSMRTTRLHEVKGTVTGGTVTPLDIGAGCRDQKYRIDLQMTVGTLDATLTHLRRKVFGKCVLYSAAITGTVALSD